MQPTFFFQWRRFSLSVLLLVGLASLSAFGGDTGALARESPVVDLKSSASVQRNITAATLLPLHSVP